MSDFIPCRLQPEEFVLLHKNDLTFLRNEIHDLLAALDCVTEMTKQEHEGLAALLALVCDKARSLHDGLTPAQMENAFFKTRVEIRAKESEHVQ